MSILHSLLGALVYYFKKINTFICVQLRDCTK